MNNKNQTVCIIATSFQAARDILLKVAESDGAKQNIVRSTDSWRVELNDGLTLIAIPRAACDKIAGFVNKTSDSDVPVELKASLKETHGLIETFLQSKT